MVKRLAADQLPAVATPAASRVEVRLDLVREELIALPLKLLASCGCKQLDDS